MVLPAIGSAIFYYLKTRQNNNIDKGWPDFILIVHPVKSAQKFSLNKRLSYGLCFSSADILDTKMLTRNKKKNSFFFFFNEVSNILLSIYLIVHYFLSKKYLCQLSNNITSFRLNIFTIPISAVNR